MIIPSPSSDGIIYVHGSGFVRMEQSVYFNIELRIILHGLHGMFLSCMHAGVP